MEVTFLSFPRPLLPRPVSVPQGFSGSSGEGVAEELCRGERGHPAPAARSGARARAKEGPPQV